MRKFMLFVGGLVALFILLANLGPMVLLGLGVWLLYIIFKKFVKSDSTMGKIGWIVLGLFVLTMVLTNIYSIIGIAAAAALYYIYKSWNKEEAPVVEVVKEDNDPFTNFEREWAELNR